MKTNNYSSYLIVFLWCCLFWRESCSLTFTGSQVIPMLSNSLRNIPNNLMNIPKMPLTMPNFPSFAESTSTDSPMIYFTGAGIYFWWQLGAAKYLLETYDHHELKKLPMLGASAGSITSAMLLTRADIDAAPRIAINLANEYDIFSKKNTGLACPWGKLLRTWLEQTLPDELILEDVENLRIAISPTLAPPKFVSGFQNKSDLVDAICASCHIPLLLDGRPFAYYRGEAVVDGSFWYFVTKNRWTGLPLPPEAMSAEEKKKSIFWIDYSDDEQFMQSVSGNFLELITPDMMYDMMDLGYKYMKQEVNQERLRIPTSRFRSVGRMLNVKRAQRMASSLFPEDFSDNMLLNFPSFSM